MKNWKFRIKGSKFTGMIDFLPFVSLIYDKNIVHLDIGWIVWAVGICWNRRI